MKLKLTPAEMLESFKLLDDSDKLEFMRLVMLEIENINDDQKGSFPMSSFEEDLHMLGLPQIVTDSSKHARKLTVRVALKGIKPPIWRKIELPSNLILESFAHVVLVSMGWDMEHMHQFSKGDVYYSVPTEDMGGFNFGLVCNEDSRNFTVGDLISEKGDNCEFEYDFGDSWEHKITVKDVCDYKDDENRTIVRLIGGKRACPPEDIGGVWGYSDYLELLKHPRSKEAKEKIEWYGMVDPEAFDLKGTALDIEIIPGNGE